MQQITFDSADAEGLTIFTRESVLTNMLTEALRMRGHQNVSNVAFDESVSIEPRAAVYGKFAEEYSERLFFVASAHLDAETAKAAVEFVYPRAELRFEFVERA